MARVNVVDAVGIFMPVLKALILEAESTGKPGEEKHAAVAEAAEATYRTLQRTGSVKEIKDVPWDLVAPVVVPAVGGIISILVAMLNKLLGAIWGTPEAPKADA